MILDKKGLENKAQWEAAGYALPKFDREAVTKATKENPFPNGFRYRGLADTTDYENLYATGYSSTVTYKNYTCTLTLK